MDDKETEREARREAARARVEAGVQERLLARRAREREEDVKAGRPQRGLFTSRRHVRGDDDDRDDDHARDERSRRDRGGDESRGTGFFGSRRARRDEKDRPRTGAKRSVMKAITQLPSYFRLLLGLISDSRVSKVDRFFVIAAAAYILSPIDFVPDIIPFFGEVDDVFLLMLALQRLVNNAGRSVILTHWRGNPDEVHNLNFARIVSAAGFFLPSQIKRRLFRMAGIGRKKR
ncbi:MAG: DUF1232 domain-containing protein [Gemmatimonadaceae bacterium]